MTCAGVSQTRRGGRANIDVLATTYRAILKVPIGQPPEMIPDVDDDEVRQETLTWNSSAVNTLVRVIARTLRC